MKKNQTSFKNGTHLDKKPTQKIKQSLGYVNVWQKSGITAKSYLKDLNTIDILLCKYLPIN